MYMGRLRMARQISVSNEVYELLSKNKGKKSFSEVIKENLILKEEKKRYYAFRWHHEKRKKET